MPLPKVSGVFRVGSDYDLRFAPSGIAVGSFRAVGSQSKKNDNDEWETTAEIWVTVTVFGKQAEACANLEIVKGAQVDILGSISIEDWETKDGEKRQTVKVIADAIGVREQRDQRGGGQQRQQQAPQQAGRQGDPDPWGPPSGSVEEPPF